MQVVEPRRPSRQDTFDLRDQIAPDDHSHYAQDTTYPSDEEHSVLEDDSDGEERDDYMDDDDGSSSLSIPNESIDFDLVYALHSFAATVEGQANVVKGDSLFLMDDSNSYWWLVRVLKTQEVGYIPAENIETPFERLARLNKHRNVDLASATEAELKESKEFIVARNGSNQPTPSPTPGTARGGSRAVSRRSVYFTPALSVHRYPPAVWGDEEEEEEDVEWDDEPYEDEDPDIADDMENDRKYRLAQGETELPPGMEPDDGMSWEDGAVESMQAQAAQRGQPTVSSSSSDVSMEAQQEAIRRQRMQEDQQQGATGVQIVAGQGSRERLTAITDGPVSTSPTSTSSRSPSSPAKIMDPAEVVETRKVSITPPVARPGDEQQARPQANAGPRLPSTVMQEQERKRAREEQEAEDTRKRASPARPVNAADQRQGGGKLRKERDRGEVTTDDEGSRDKKKKGGVFGFLRKKDKNKDKDRALGGGSESGSMNSIASSDMRGSEESGRSSSQQHAAEATSPVTASARQQQQQAMQQAQAQKNAADPRRAQQQQPSQGAPQGGAPAQIQLSQHASQLRQRDQQQQALYQQYLNRSPSSPPEVQPSYGLQSAPAIMPGSMSFTSTTSSASGLTPTSRPRPGSLVVAPGTMDAQGVGLPDLSVVRVFAGDNLQTEATFKTVLLNASTTASDLVRQAIQRFRLPAGEDPADYFLTIKQVEGSSATLLPAEKPLGVFESLVEAAMELPKVKRSSVGSISSVASNLSMHPAIKKLSMNDFTDDSAVKFYLNRKGGDQDESLLYEDGEETILAESITDDDSRSSMQYLSPVTSGSSVALERFSSPSYRFALQVIIHPDDLPDDMVFDPLTEAIVFKDTLRDRPGSSLASPGISQTQRRKVFTFPKNATVAEVIEVGLERFGIIDGVVDGGDEVEDKMTKRRSSTRVRYGLSVNVEGRERELAPTSKVVDAFPRTPTFRATKTADNKRRSVDSAQLLLGSSDDIGPDDPMFILRRAVTYRPSSRHRSSAPLDEIALQKLHRESMSGSSTMSDSTIGANDEPKRQKSTQEIIAAQRAARSANQRAILSAQSNSARGLDVLLPGNAMIRSSRYEVDDRIRYSYVEPDGETFDISDIVEAEWRGEGGSGRERGSARDDLLQGVITKDKDRLGAKLDRVLSKIKHDKGVARGAQSTSGTSYEDLARSTSPSLYSTAENMPNSRSATPVVNGRSPTPTSFARTVSPVSHLSGYRTASPGDTEPRSRSSTATPSGSRQRAVVRPHERQQSLASVVSDSSAYRSATPGTPKATKPRVMVPKDDFGVAQMMAVIEARGMVRDKQKSLPPLDPVDNLLFGREIDLNTLHPKIREIYSDTFKQLEDMDRTLDDLLHHVAHAF